MPYKILVAIVAAVLGYHLVDRKPSIEAICTAMNKKVPLQVDEHTRLERTAAEPGNTLACYYTMMGLPLHDVDPQEFRIRAEQEIRSRLISRPEMIAMRQTKANLKFVYLTESGEKFAEITIPHRSLPDA